MWAVLGNHEYYGSIEGAEQFYRDCGILLLKDSVAHFGGVDVIGRNDRSYPCRPALCDFADGLTGFTILLDHQPSHLEEAEEAGINFQFSGHTHRGQVWQLLLNARAVENQCFVVGVNRVGEDRFGDYTGDSVIIDAFGKTIASCTPGLEEVAIADIDLDGLRLFRTKFPVLADADK